MKVSEKRTEPNFNDFIVAGAGYYSNKRNPMIEIRKKQELKRKQ